MFFRRNKVISFMIGALWIVGCDCANSRKHTALSLTSFARFSLIFFTSYKSAIFKAFLEASKNTVNLKVASETRRTQMVASSSAASYLLEAEVGKSLDLEIAYEVTQDAIPKAYSLHIFPNFTNGKLKGEMVIDFVVTDETQDIILHHKDLVIKQLVVTDLVMGTVVPSTYARDKLHPSLLRIKTLKVSLKPKKLYKVNIKYYSIHAMNSKTPFGFVWNTRSYVQNMRTEVADIATSFLEPIFSSKVFPAFDNPKYKAPFRISVARLPHHKVRCNLPIVEKGELSKDSRLLDGHKNMRYWDTFETKEPVPIFMVAFAVINQGYERNKNDVNGYKFSVWTVRDVIQQADFARIHAEKTIEFMNEITKINYPAINVDLIAVPRASNSIEEKRWGPLFYLENEILCVEELCPDEHKQRVIYNIAEKLSLEWFGKYSSSWNTLWLKDALARYFAYKISDRINEDWNLPDFIYTVTKTDHMFKDGRIMRYPLTISGRISSKDIIDMYRDDTREIMIDKATSILRMLESIIGEYRFKEGINQFMKKKTETLATKFTRRASFYNNYLQPESTNRVDEEIPSSNLWKIMEEQVENNDINLPESVSLEEAMNSWMIYKSYPLVEAIRTEGQISFSQSNYHEIEENKTNSKWIIPITITSESDPNFDNTVPSMWLRSQEKVATIASPGEGWFIINLQNKAHYRATYDKQNWNLLIDQLLKEPDKIHAYNRAQLYADSHILAADHRLDVDIPIRLSTYLVKEKKAFNWIVAIRSFKRLYAALSKNSRIEYLAHFTKCLEHGYKEFGFYTTKYDDYNVRLLKGEMLSLLCWLGNVECENTAFQIYEANESNLTNINPNLLYTVLCTVISYGHIKLNELNEKIDACNNHCHKKIMLQARSCFHHTARFDQPIQNNYFRDLINNSTKNEERFKLQMEFLSQWDSVMVFMDFIEKQITDWSSNQSGPSTVKSNYIKAMMKIVQNLRKKVYGNPETESLQRIIRIVKTFDDERYIPLLEALLEIKKTSLPGGIRKSVFSPTQDGDKLTETNVKNALETYPYPDVD